MPDATPTPFAAALDMLARRALTAHEVSSRLARRGFDPEVIDRALARLLDSRLVDDQSLAYNHARRRAEEGRVGPYRVEQELKARGIDGTLAKEAVRAAFGPEDLADALRRAVAKAAGGATGLSSTDPAARIRLARRLVRRGFPVGLVQRTLSEPLGQEDEQLTVLPIEDNDNAIP